MLGDLLGVDLPDGTAVGYVVVPWVDGFGRKVDGVLEEGWLYQDGLNPLTEWGGGAAGAARHTLSLQLSIALWNVETSPKTA